MNHSKYSEEHKQFLFSFVPNHHYREIVEEFNRRYPDTEFEMKHCKNFIANNKLNTGFNGRFEKGQTSPTKGRKWSEYMSPEAQKNSRTTCFSKGNIPLNHKPVGTISVRRHRKGAKRKLPEVYIKVAEPNKWKLYNRYLWEQANGPIPKGYVICFRDGDTLNCKLENLRCVSRATAQILSNMSDTRGEARDVAISIGELQTAIRNKSEAKYGKSNPV